LVRTDHGSYVLLYQGLLREEAQLRQFALRILDKDLSDATLACQIDGLASFSVEERTQIVHELENAGLVDRILTRFSSLKPEYQRKALRLLCSPEAKSHLEFLKECMALDAEEIVLLSAELLSSVGEDIPAERVEHLLNSSSVDVRLRTIEIVEKSGAAEMLHILAPLLEHSSDEVAWRAAECIQLISGRQLLAKFNSIEERAREQVAKILYKLNPELVTEISERLPEMSEQERLHSVQVLLLLADEESARAELENLMRDDDSRIRATAVKSVHHFSEEKIAFLLKMLLYDVDPRVRTNAVEEVPEQVEEKIVERLLELTHGDHGRERANALKKLWDMGYRDYEISVAGMIKDDDPYIRASGIWVAGEIGTAALMELVAEYSADEDCMVRRNVILAIRKGGTEGQVRDLFAMTKDPDDSVRKMAADTLRERLKLEVDPGEQ